MTDAKIKPFHLNPNNSHKLTCNVFKLESSQNLEGGGILTLFNTFSEVHRYKNSGDIKDITNTLKNRRFIVVGWFL